MMHHADQIILIIEQDHLARALYLRELSRAYQTLACSNPYDALVIARSQPLSAVILEPLLANGPQWSLLSALREQLGPAVPIILCSTLDERRRGMVLGATVYVVKPVLPTVLLAHLQRLVTHAPANGCAAHPTANTTRDESML